MIIPQQRQVLHCSKRHLGLCAYRPVWEAMQRFTQQRDESTVDELWLLQHEPIYTLGVNSKNRHIIDAGKITVMQTDRGGQVTYHGPGQLVIYTLLDLRRLGLGVRKLVEQIEQAVLDLLSTWGINATRIASAPGIYIAKKKICSLGLRVRRHCCFHGLSLNVDMDTTPFAGINPCGLAALEMTQLSHFGINYPISDIANRLVDHLALHLGYAYVTDADNKHGIDLP